MKQIEHDKNEKRPTNRLWWELWAIVAVTWIGFFFLIGISWPSVALGAFTGMTLASWAVDLTGNKFMG